MKRKILIMAGLVLALQACSDEGGHPVQNTALSQASVMTLKAVDVDVHYVTSGTVTSDHRVSISSRISGYIRKLPVREGDHVKKGQVLVRVDPVNARQGLIQAEADLANADADLKRYESLYRDHAASKQQLDRVRLRYKITRSQVAQARNHLGYAEVRSPVNGVVVEKRMSKGDLASPGAPILMIEDPVGLLVKTYVSEQFISILHEGDAEPVWIPALNKTIEGHIRQIVKAADPLSHQFLVKLALASDSGVYPGMFAEVHFSVGKRMTIAVPTAALVNRSGLVGIYVLDAQGIAHYRQLRIGNHLRFDGGKPGHPLRLDVEVLAGLKAGDVIAWRSDGGLRSGDRVKAE